MTGRLAFSCFLLCRTKFGSDPKAGSWRAAQPRQALSPGHLFPGRWFFAVPSRPVRILEAHETALALEAGSRETYSLGSSLEMGSSLLRCLVTSTPPTPSQEHVVERLGWQDPRTQAHLSGAHRPRSENVLPSS